MQNNAVNFMYRQKPQVQGDKNIKKLEQVIFHQTSIIAQLNKTIEDKTKEISNLHKNIEIKNIENQSLKNVIKHALENRFSNNPNNNLTNMTNMTNMTLVISNNPLKEDNFIQEDDKIVIFI
jgi:uncharacterized coiled-coil protein SlyX